MQTIAYDLTMELTEAMLGSLPASPDILATYVQAKAREMGVPDDDLLAEIAALPKGELQEQLTEEKSTCFARDGDKLFLWNYLVKGFLKESGNVQKDVLGIKALRFKLDQYLFVSPRQLFLLREGESILKSDDIYTRPIRVMTAQGPRVSIAASERVYLPVSLCCTLVVIEAGWKILTELVLRELLNYGQFHGLGQFANGGFGTFAYRLSLAE